MKYLFLGGRCDGQRVEVTDHLPVVRVMYYAEPEPIEPCVERREFDPLDTACNIAEYFRVEIRVLNSRFAVYTADKGWPAANVIEHLIAGYPKNT